MPIDLTCTCGTKLRVKDELAGKRIKCPKCNNTVSTPAPRALEEPISVLCQCGKPYRAKASSAGKTFKCSGCGQSVSIPAPNSEFSDEFDPLAAAPTNNPLGSLLDVNLPALGLPLGDHVPYRAPQNPTSNTHRASNKTASKPSEASEGSGVTFDLNHEPIVLITAVLCILFGLGRIVTYGSFGILFSPNVLLSVGGLIIVASLLIRLGILAAGVGLLLKQDWAEIVGKIAGSMYFVFAIIQLIMFFAGLSMLAASPGNVPDLAAR